MIVPGMFVCSSFLISVCMFIVSKALLILSAIVIVRTGGAIWLNQFATVFFNVCSAVTSVLCFVPVLRGCVWHACCYVRMKALLQCLQLLRGGIWTCMRCPCLSLVGFGMETMLANFHMCGIMLMLRAAFNILMRNASPREHICFKYLIFSLSGPFELLFLLCFSRHMNDCLCLTL